MPNSNHNIHMLLKKPRTLSWPTVTAMLALTILSACLHNRPPQYGDCELVYAWDQLQWLPTTDSTSGPSPLITSVKQDTHGQLYAAVPRWQGHTPATLNKLIDRNGQAYLEPFPNALMNRPDNANGLKSVIDFYIDELGMMWILDQGNVKGAASADGDQKLIKWDIQGNKLMDIFAIGQDIAPYGSSFLSGLAIDTENHFAYLADAGVNADPLEAALIVLDLKERKFRRVLHQHVSVQDQAGVRFSINGKPVWEQTPMRTGITGMALSPDLGTLYYCPLSSQKLYAIDTRFLQDFDIPTAAMPNGSTCLGNKGCCSSYLYCHPNGTLYYTMLDQNGVGAYLPDSAKFSPTTTQPTLAWPSSIACTPDSNWLFVTHNNLHCRGSVQPTEPRQALWKLYVGRNLTTEASE